MSVPSGSAGSLQPLLEHLGMHQAASVSSITWLAGSTSGALTSARKYAAP